MEVQAVKSYWHMAPHSNYGNASAFTLNSAFVNERTTGSDSDDEGDAAQQPEWVGVYDDIFAARRMVGNVGALDATTSTWFGDALEYVHGINIMPLSPATATVFDDWYVSGQYPVLASALPGPIPEQSEYCAANAQCVTANLLEGKCCPNADGVVLACCDPTVGGVQRMQSEWKAYVYAFLAIVDRDAAWDRILNMTGFGPGNSKSNMLYWTASRAPKLAGFNSNAKADSAYFTAQGSDLCTDNSACDAVGMTGSCCPTASVETGGIFLGCCAKTGAG